MGSQDQTELGSMPDGVFSLLDTDLYKLTMQCAILRHFPHVAVSYAFTNRTADMKLTRAAYRWLETQISRLGAISCTSDELQFLQKACPYLSPSYLSYLETFRLRPSEHIFSSFSPSPGTTATDADVGKVHVEVRGLWVETILYEIPLLALTSEAYFKFCDRDWDHSGQEERAYEKGLTLLDHGCMFSEFGTRRRRDYRTQDMVLQGLIRASRDGKVRGSRGKLTGTSNVHFAMQYKISPIGTVAHEWFMGIAAITNSYEEATEIALRHWVATFGEGILGIALTDTFGTPTFLRSFRLPITHLRSKGVGEQLPQHALAASSTASARHGLNSTGPPAQTSRDMVEDVASATKKTYAQVFTGVRQDSGDPNTFVQIMRDFYDREGITDKKTIVFSDSLNIKLCLEYKQKAEEAGFEPSFGVGTFLTNDFKHLSSGDKSVPLNIVIKLSSASGRPAVKISDNIGKNTGDKETVDLVKHKLGYVEKTWEAGDEKARWGSASGDELNKDPR